MGRIFQPGLLLVLMIVSLTLLGARVESLVTHSLKSHINSGQPAYVLLLGVDARPGETRTRTDTIILAGLDRKLGRVVLLSIPRDTRIADYGPMRKINMVNQIKGPQATCQEVGKLVGADVHHYIATNFLGFEKLIDLMGGVVLDVEFDLYSPATDTYIVRGQQRLNGKQALLYVRFRGTADADIGRTARQQKLMLALYHQFMSAGTIHRLPEMIKEIRNNVDTNISMGDMLFMARLLSTISEDNIISQTLPGYHYIDPYTGGSYWEVDRQVARSILPSLYWGQNYEVYQETPDWKRGW